MLRLLNLTLMRSIVVGNLVKRLLVRLLIRSKGKDVLVLTRTIDLSGGGIHISDVIRGPRSLPLDALQYGAPFRGVHMASAGYMGVASHEFRPRTAPLDGFRTSGEIRVETALPAEAGVGAIDARSPA